MKESHHSMKFISKDASQLSTAAALGVICFGVLMIMFGLAGCNSKNQSTTNTVIRPQPTRTLSEKAAAIATLTAVPPRPTRERTATLVSVADDATEYSAAVVADGEAVYTSLCAACHGIDALGIQNLGKDLINSEFVDGQSDEELLAFINVGRPIWDAENTTGIDMPPKGGNPTLTDEQILSVIAYIRTLSGSGVAVAAVETNASDTSSAEPTPTLVDPFANQNDEAVDSNVSNGETTSDDGQMVYTAICSACHGMDARGIENLGKDLIDSEFVDGLSDDELLTFIKLGRPIWDAENTTGIDMPPKGGNPALTDDQILAVIAYIRTLE